MKRFAYILSIGISAIISCTDSPGTYYPRYSTFPNEKAISARVIELDTAFFRYPFRVAVKDSIAIVMDLHGIDYYAHLFKYPGFQYLSSFGRRGDSPTEMLSMDNVRFYNHKVWTLDANKRELTRLGFSSSGDSLLRDEAVSYTHLTLPTT